MVNNLINNPIYWGLALLGFLFYFNYETIKNIFIKRGVDDFLDEKNKKEEVKEKVIEYDLTNITKQTYAYLENKQNELEVYIERINDSRKNKLKYIKKQKRDIQDLVMLLKKHYENLDKREKELI